MTGFRFNEKYLSQNPALQLLLNLGGEYIFPEQAEAYRRQKRGLMPKLLTGAGRVNMKEVAE